MCLLGCAVATLTLIARRMRHVRHLLGGSGFSSTPTSLGCGGVLDEEDDEEPREAEQAQICAVGPSSDTPVSEGGGGGTARLG